MSKDLEIVALFASDPARKALRSSFVMKAASAFFYDAVQKFAAHPSSTLVYQGLEALENEAVVQLAELLRDEHNLFPVARQIRGRDQLLRHRDMISHPSTVRWRSPDRQQFADDGHKWSPVRVGLIWDVQKAINERLVAEHMEIRVNDVPVDFEMALTLNFILARSVRMDVQPHPPDALHGYLNQQKPGFIRALEAHPDGVVEKNTDPEGA
jgi:hypothetical protein